MCELGGSPVGAVDGGGGCTDGIGCDRTSTSIVSELTEDDVS